MIFFVPTKVYSERGCVRKRASEWAALGKKALIVTGQSSAHNGALADVTQALRENGRDYVIFDKTEENPSVEMVMQVRKMGLQEQVDFVIGIGGGSPMDAAKAIALMIAQKDADAELLYRSGKYAALPVVEIPTTCGTGSEATPYAILTLHQERTKASLPHRIWPAFALVDGSYLMSAGRQLLVNTAIDALGHFIESYINANATEFSKMLCEYGMKVWSEGKHVLIGAERTVEDCDRLLLAATLGGMAISHTGTALPHGLSYYLTYEKKVPHGRAVGWFLPGYLSCAQPLVRRQVLKLAGFPDEQYFSAFIRSLLGAMETDEELVNRAVKGMLENESKLKNVPFPVTEEMLNQICRSAQI